MLTNAPSFFTFFCHFFASDAQASTPLLAVKAGCFERDSANFRQPNTSAAQAELETVVRADL
jgi:hypothetical protein